MAEKFVAAETPDFEIRYEAIDATIGGIFGGHADTQRRSIRSIAHYYVDGMEVSQAEYIQILNNQHKTPIDG